MAEKNKFSSWYMGADELGRSNEAHDIFKEVLAAFASELSQDKVKIKWIIDSKHGNLESLFESVIEARIVYEEARKRDTKVYKMLVKFSEKVYYYSGIMDVLVSHHPEYVALVYGAMKFLFVGVVNHQRLLSQLCAGLTNIAMILPRAELILQLYPTHYIKKVIVAMYANILRFLLRALSWYQESRPKRMLHSFTRPSELRYDDLIDTIFTLSRNMTEMASTNSHAEQRDMHTEQKQILASLEHLTTELSNIKRVIVADQALNTTARVEFRQQLSEVQLGQLISHITVVDLLDPAKAFQTSKLFAKRRVRSLNQGPQFWLNTKVQRWNQSSESSLIMINGTRKLRSHFQYFCVESIAQLLDTQIPVIWGLRASGSNEKSTHEITTIDLLKYLICQGIRANRNIHTDAAVAPRLGAYLRARTEEDWIGVLLSVLQSIPLLYIILDVELLSQSLQTLSRDFWPGGFFRMFSELSKRGIDTVLRVMLVSYGSPLLRGSLGTEYIDHVLNVGNTRSVYQQSYVIPVGISSLNLNTLTDRRRTRSQPGRATRRRKHS